MILFIIVLLKISQILAIEEIYLTQNENVYLPKKSIILQSNHTFYTNLNSEAPDVQQQLIQISNDLLNIDTIYDIEEKVHGIISFVDHNQEDQYICLLNQDLIDCKFKISNQFINNNLDIQKGSFTQIPTISIQCQQVFNLLQNTYIIQCRKDFGLTLKLLNQNNKLLDTLIIRTKYKQQQQSIQDANQIIVYEIDQQFCHFSIISINQEKFTFILSQFTLDLGENHIQSGVINNVDLISHNYIQVIYQYLIINIDLQNFEIFQISGTKGLQEYYNVFTINGNSYYLMLDSLQQDTISYGLNIFYYNLSKGKILKSKIINQNLVLILSNYIIIFNNEKIHLELYQDYKSVHILIGISYLVALTQQNDIKFLQINDLPHVIQYSHSQCLSIHQFDYFFYLSQVLQYKVNQYSFKNPKLIKANVQKLTYVYEENLRSYIYNFQIQGLPFSISLDLNKNQIIKQLTNYITISNQYLQRKYKNEKIIIFGTAETAKYMILIFGNHNIINIFNQVSNNKNAIKIPFYSDNSRIFQSISKQNFVIVNNQTIIGYQYQDYLREIWVFKVSQKIYDILQIGDNLGIQQEECKEIKIDLGNMTFLQMNQSLQKNCTFTINNGLFITILKDKITIKGSTTNKLSYTFNNLLQHIYFVDINCLIIFELQGALIIAKLYNIQSQKLYFLYNLPLYDFEIVEPISYKVAQTYLAIKVKNKENQFFVMVYNIKYFATNCLIKVIEIDPDFNEFNYIGHSQIFVQFNKQIIVHFLQWVLLNLTNLQFDSNTYYNKSFVELQKKSDLFLQTQSIIIELVAINTNQQLQIINSSIPVYYSIRQQNKEIFLDNIFGSIDFLLYHNSNGSEIKLNPLLIAGQLSCLQPFQNQVCISKNDQIVLNYFDKQNKLIIHLPEITLSQYQFLRKLNNNYELFLIFSNQSGCSYLINQNGQILTNKTLDVRHLFPNQPPPDLIFSVIGNLGILKSNNQPLLVFKILENALSQFYQFGESYESQTSLVKILYVNNNYIIFHSSKIQKETFSVSILNDQFYIIKKIQVDIKHLIPENDIKIVSSLVFIEIIEYFFKDFIIDADLILCYEFLFCQRMDFQINFNNKKYTFEITSIIRYPYREYFIKQVVLISKTQFIIQFQNQHKTAYFYNLNNKSAFIVDSFYKETKDVQLEFYDYDQYIEIRQVENYVELTLMNIKPYTIKCSQQCSQSQEYIQLLNQVSNLQIVLFPKIKEKEKIPFQFSLVILNFITVLTYTHFKRNRKNFSNQICK